MKAKDLQTIFIESRRDKDYNPLEEELTFFDGEEYLYLKKSHLNSKEILLIKALSKNIQPSIWQDYLYNNGLEPEHIQDDLQIIQVRFKHQTEHQKLWIDTFINYFNTVIDYFILDHQTAIIIIKAQAFDEQEIKSFISLLDEDFSTNTQLLIGFVCTQKYIKAVFEEERKIFVNLADYQSIIFAKDHYLTYYLYPTLNQSPYAQFLKQQLSFDQDAHELVDSMWQTQGNISQAAKALFVHRNTLNYRMDKFKEQTQLDLRRSNDLLLAKSILSI